MKSEKPQNLGNKHKEHKHPDIVGQVQKRPGDQGADTLRQGSVRRQLEQKPDSHKQKHRGSHGDHCQKGLHYIGRYRVRQFDGQVLMLQPGKHGDGQDRHDQRREDTSRPQNTSVDDP